MPPSLGNFGRSLPPEWRGLPPDVVGSFDMLGAVPIPNHGVINPVNASNVHSGSSRKKKRGKGKVGKSNSEQSKQSQENPQSGFSRRQKKNEDRHKQEDQPQAQQEKTPYYRVPFLGGGSVWDLMTTWGHPGAYNSGTSQAGSLAASGGLPIGSGGY